MPIGQSKGHGKSAPSKGKGKFQSRGQGGFQKEPSAENFRKPLPPLWQERPLVSQVNRACSLECIDWFHEYFGRHDRISSVSIHGRVQRAYDESLDVPSLQEIDMLISPIVAVRERLRKWGKRGTWGNDDNPMTSLPRNDQTDEPPENSLQASVREQPEVAFFSTQGTCGILDTGASKSVIGNKLLPALIESLTPHVRQQVFRTSCDITFRFGNQGTLGSQHALVVPLKSAGLGLKIAIVPGETPPLLSNTPMRTLKASLNSDHHTLSSPLLKHVVKLKLSPRGLFVLDLNDLLSAQKDLHKSVDAPMAETFLSSDFSSENQQNEPSQPITSNSQLKSCVHMIAPAGPGPQVQSSCLKPKSRL